MRPTVLPTPLPGRFLGATCSTAPLADCRGAPACLSLRPAPGRPAFALTIAAAMLARPDTTALTVVTPTEHLKHQWARAAHRLGIALDPEYTNSQGQASADFAGVAVTYAQLA